MSWKDILLPGSVPPQPDLMEEGAVIASLLRHIFMGKMEITGSENVPAEGAYVIACNHSNWADMFLMPYLSPEWPRMMTHPKVMSMLGPVSALGLSRMLGCYTASLKATIEILNTQPVVMCPEGWAYVAGDYTRPFHTGAAVASSITKVPIIPVNIQYSYHPGNWIYKLPAPWVFIVCGLLQIFKRKGVKVMIGEPIYPIEGQDAHSATLNLREQIVKLGDKQ